MRTARHLALLSLLALPLLAACVSSQRGTARDAARRLPLTPCRVEHLDEEVLCGSYRVWEDREARSGRKIPIRVVVLPALGPDPAPDPLFLFSGGPGEASARNAGGWGGFLRPIRECRDLVFIDQRGTGGSNLLQCKLPGGPDDLAGYFEDFLGAEVAAACRVELEPRADLSLYTTSIAMDDIDEVRQWLGYERINLAGGSYGTRAVQTYLRRHPEHVRTAILEGVVAPRQHLPLYHARDGRDALDGLFAVCAADETCAGAFPDLAAEHREVIRRLDAEPARVTLPHPESGDPVEVTIRREFFAEQLRFLNYSPQPARTLPLLVHRAYLGDFEPFARLSVRFEPELREALAFGMFLSVTCAEDLPYITPQAAAALTADTYLGDYRVRIQKAACGEWVRGEIPADFHQPVRSDAPVLMISGPYDPVTPPLWAEEVGRTLPNSRHVVIPNAHHSIFGLSNHECALGIESEFLDRGSAEGIDTSCVTTMERSPFVTSVEELEELLAEAAGEGEDEG